MGFEARQATAYRGLTSFLCWKEARGVWHGLRVAT
jgi:hypothetical protein